MKIIFTHVSILLFVVVATACGKMESAVPPAPVIPAYQLTPKEAGVLNAFFDDDAKAFATGNNSVMGINIARTTSNEIAVDYSKNEVAADAKYKNKTLFVTAKIVAIQSGINNEPFLTLNGANIFQTPQARFKGNDIDRISKLGKGQKIYLICVVRGEIVGTPMLDGCVFADAFAEDIKQKALAKFTSALAGNKEIFNADESVIFLSSIYLARKLNDGSACESGSNDKCLLEINKFVDGNKKNDKSNDSKQEWTLIVKEFEKYGFVLPKKNK